MGLSLPFIGAHPRGEPRDAGSLEPRRRRGCRRLRRSADAPLRARAQIVVMGLFALGIVTGSPVGPLFLAGNWSAGWPRRGSSSPRRRSPFARAGRCTAGARGHRARGDSAGGSRWGSRWGGSSRIASATPRPSRSPPSASSSRSWQPGHSVPDLRAPIARRAPSRRDAARDERSSPPRRRRSELRHEFRGRRYGPDDAGAPRPHRHVSVFARNEQGTAGMLMGLLTIVNTAVTPFAGRLGDRWHAHARVATVSLATLVPGLLTVGLSKGALGIGVGIAIIGLGTAGLGPSLLVIMGAIVPRERQGTGPACCSSAETSGGCSDRSSARRSSRGTCERPTWGPRRSWRASSLRHCGSRGIERRAVRE